jgi:SNF2 family DNA or RNA helicase
MVTNVSKDPSCKTNLILAPMALLDQWKLEIDLKTNLGFTCHIYHGARFFSLFLLRLVCSDRTFFFSKGIGKLKKKEDVLKYDVILTTYQVCVVLEFSVFVLS